MNFRCAVRTHVGLRRKLNEDAVLSLPDRGLWAVSDGMGGHHAGDVASASVIRALAACGPGDTADALASAAQGALEQVNAELIALAAGRGERTTIGATVVGLAVKNGRMACFWAGDSRAYRLRESEIVQLTRDHSLVQDLVDAGMLAADEADSHPNANVITRAVGAADYLSVESVAGELAKGDVFLLASDGLTRLVTAPELRKALLCEDPEKAADHLLDLALARGGQDNISLIIISTK